MKTKRMLCILVGILLLGSLVTVTPSIAADSTAPLVFTWNDVTTTPEAWSAWQNWAKTYYPDIVNFNPPISTNGWTPFINKVSMSLTSGERWDAVGADDNRFASEWGQPGIIQPVMDLVNKADAKNIQQFIYNNPSLVKRFSYNGQLMAIPWLGNGYQKNTTALLWRGDILKAVGFSTPPKTTAQLEKYCAAVKAKFPKVLPLGLPTTAMNGMVLTPISGVKGYQVVKKDGTLTGYYYLKSTMWPMAQYVHKYYNNGWLSLDINVLNDKLGYRGLLGEFAAGHVGMMQITYSGADDTAAMLMSVPKSYKPIMSSDILSGPKGIGHTINAPPMSDGIYFAAKSLGNEAAQIRLIKYIDWMIQKKNDWWYIPQKYGAPGWRTTYKIDTKNNKVTILSDNGKLGFGPGAGAMGLLLRDNTQNIMRLPLNASALQKKAVEIRKVVNSWPASLENMCLMVAMPRYSPKMDPYPSAAAVAIYTNAIKLETMGKVSDAVLEKALDDWLTSLEKSGYWVYIKDVQSGIKSLMDPDDYAKAMAFFTHEQ